MTPEDIQEEVEEVVDNNEHNDDPDRRYDLDVEEVTAYVDDAE